MPDALSFPQVRTWELVNHAKQEARTYSQTELTIDGEVQLFQLVNRVIDRLNRTGFPWQEVTALFSDDVNEPIDVAKAAGLLTLAMSELPEAAAECACIMFGIFPSDPGAGRNKSFDDDKAFIRSVLKTAQLVDIIQTFVEQNDWERLTRPFARAATRVVEMGMSAIASAQQPASIEPPTSSPTPDSAAPSNSDARTRGGNSTAR